MKIWQKFRNGKVKPPAAKYLPKPDQTKIYSRLKDNWDYLQSLLGVNDDIIFRRFNLGTKSGEEALVIYIENMVDKTMLHDNIIKPLMYDSRPNDARTAGIGLQDMVFGSMLAVANVTATQSMDKVVANILAGGVILIIDGLNDAFSVDIRSFEQRSVTEPDAEVLVRGPREGFTENLNTNIVLIRRKLKSRNLIIKSLEIGRETKTKVSIAYLQGFASPEMVDEVLQRLTRIDIDGILESNYLEEFIEDNPYSPFPQIMHTERPDRVTANLLEGRIAIITDGTPVALIIPVEISAFITSPDDYSERYYIGSSIRLLRYFAFMASLLLPSFFIAITTFHQEMIPPKLILSMASYRAGVPFTTLTEALLMESTFEVLREAGMRLPRSVGSAVSIVGALVIGQAAVQAGLVSPLMVIIVAFTGIASFSIPAFNLGLALRMLRFPLMLLAGTLGLLGVFFGITMICIHITSLRSFGMPYTSSLAPLQLKNLKDIFIRLPWWAMDERPAGLNNINHRRQAPNLKPSLAGSAASKKEEP